MTIVKHVNAKVHEIWWPAKDGDYDDPEASYYADQITLNEWYQCSVCKQKFRKLTKAQHHKCGRGSDAGI